MSLEIAIFNEKKKKTKIKKFKKSVAESPPESVGRPVLQRETSKIRNMGEI